MKTIADFVLRHLKKVLLLIVFVCVITIGKNYYVIGLEVSSTNEAIRHSQLAAEAWEDKARKEAWKVLCLKDSVRQIRTERSIFDSTAVAQIEQREQTIRMKDNIIKKLKHENDSLRTAISNVRQSGI